MYVSLKSLPEKRWVLKKWGTELETTSQEVANYAVPVVCTLWAGYVTFQKHNEGYRQVHLSFLQL